ncbi:TPA: TIGR03752 family integrating conjugative element protein, partial [Escherichia coli]|nr:TIGR03752 family integrating conjugative element protein [Escherichia coli]HDJ0680102.1 TIGR03752 family integrating conjugative element protein [Escherichia coli]HEB3876435.1 TIGR03752 family integrating conjugative element protein [Escherichia coli]
MKSNTIVKYVVPCVVVAGILTGLKSCGGDTGEPSSAESSGTLAGLSPDELKALGVEGDTPEDTLRTLIGRMNQVRERQLVLDKQNEKLLKENEMLRKRGTDVSGQVSEAVAGLQKNYEQSQRQFRNEQNALMTQVQSLTEQLKRQQESADAGAGGQESDIPAGLGLDGLGSVTGSAASPGTD